MNQCLKNNRTYESTTRASRCEKKCPHDVLKELATDNEFESEAVCGQSRLRDLNHGKKEPRWRQKNNTLARVCQEEEGKNSGREMECTVLE